jgi:hypothetical protein
VFGAHRFELELSKMRKFVAKALQQYKTHLTFFNDHLQKKWNLALQHDDHVKLYTPQTIIKVGYNISTNFNI